MEINNIISETIETIIVAVKMNEFNVAEHADIVYLYGYCDGNDLQGSR
jgi:hypothetical protein